MLQNLHVKNLALIDEIEVDFKEGLNILTGETGAGKSFSGLSALRSAAGTRKTSYVRVRIMDSWSLHLSWRMSGRQRS